MKLIFERSVPGRRCSILPACDVEETPLPESLRRAEAPVLPELSEQELQPPLYGAEPPCPRRELRLLSARLLHHEV